MPKKLSMPPVIRTRITQHATAVRGAAFAGAAHPDDRDWLKQQEPHKRIILEKAITKAIQEKQDEIDRLNQVIQDLHLKYLMESPR